MGIRHKDYNLEGIQFHPESFLTQYGTKIPENFINNWIFLYLSIVHNVVKYRNDNIKEVEHDKAVGKSI